MKKFDLDLEDNLEEPIEEVVPVIPVKDIVERITAPSYMANEKKYSQAERDSFQIEANNLITLLKDFGYEKRY